MRTKKPLFQWDINQKFINCTGQYIDFIFDNDLQPYRVEIKEGICLIPDEFLQTEGKKTVYECLSDGTITENKIIIHGRPKPPSYVYTTTEKLTFEGLVQKVNTTIDDIISRANSGEFNGYTPKKGIDYFTLEEIQNIEESAAEKARVDTYTKDEIQNLIKQPDWNQNDVTSSDYIKNRPFYEGFKDKLITSYYYLDVLSKENESGTYYFANLPSSWDTIKEGTGYTVRICYNYGSFVTYENVPVEEIYMGSGVYILDYLGGTEEYPFKIYQNKVFFKEPGTYHLQIYKTNVPTVVTLQTKYLPTTNTITDGQEHSLLPTSGAVQNYVRNKLLDKVYYVDVVFDETYETDCITSATQSYIYDAYVNKKIIICNLEYRDTSKKTYRIVCQLLNQINFTSPVYFYGVFKDENDTNNINNLIVIKIDRDNSISREIIPLRTSQILSDINDLKTQVQNLEADEKLTRSDVQTMIDNAIGGVENGSY